MNDWGLGIGDWAQSPIPNPQSPIPNPQSPIPIIENLLKIVFNRKCKEKLLYYNLFLNRRHCKIKYTYTNIKYVFLARISNI